MSEQHPQVVIVLTQMPDGETAARLAEFLVTEKLAACVNILPAGTSVYFWQGELQRDSETTMLIKTTAECYDALQTAILQQHPYELPEIIRLRVDGGLPAYLQWVNENVSNNQ